MSAWQEPKKAGMRTAQIRWSQFDNQTSRMVGIAVSVYTGR